MRIVTNNERITIMEKDNKHIELVLAMREGPTNHSRICVKEYTPKQTEGYDVPQYKLDEPDKKYFVDSFECDGFEIWGSNEDVVIDHDDDGDPIYETVIHWYMDKK